MGGQNLLMPISKKSRYRLKEGPTMTKARIEIRECQIVVGFIWILYDENGQVFESWGPFNTKEYCHKNITEMKRLMAEATIEED